MLNRRAFLGGVFGGVAAGGLIVRATPAEIDRFAAHTPVEAPVAVNSTEAHAPSGVLYDAQGRAVCRVVRAQPVQMVFERRVEETTRYSDAVRLFAPVDAPMRVTFEAEVADAQALYDMMAPWVRPIDPPPPRRRSRRS